LFAGGGGGGGGGGYAFGADALRFFDDVGNFGALFFVGLGLLANVIVLSISLGMLYVFCNDVQQTLVIFALLLTNNNQTPDSYIR